MRKRSLILIILALLLLVSSTTVFAGGGEKEVGLVVQLPDHTITKIVTVPADATAADVLVASGLDVGMADTDWGKAVCSIEGIGSPNDDCFADKDHAWAYFHLENGEWKASEVGVSGFKPEDKSVEGFAWSEFDDNYAPTVIPPVKTFDEIQAASQTGLAKLFSQPLFLLLLLLVLVLALGGIIAMSRKNKKQA
ncbi:MAG: hypothetical protein DSY55_05945 [Clostridia bacterium]|nr:MAG: hypothetical protein DSY55_05945 [Clostridia bacterium]